MCTLMIINVHVYHPSFYSMSADLPQRGKESCQWNQWQQSSVRSPSGKWSRQFFWTAIAAIARAYNTSEIHIKHLLRWNQLLAWHNFDKNQRLLWDGHRISLQHRCIWPKTIASQGAEFHSAAAQISLRRVVQWYGIIHWSKSTGWVPLRQSRSRNIIRYLNWLVVSTPLKNMKVSWDYFSTSKESRDI